MEKELKVVSVRLVEEQPIMSNTPIQTPIDAVRLIGDKMRLFDREVVCVINLRSDGKPICCNFVSMGAINECIVHPRELLKSAVLTNSVSMLMIHNHPSGTLKPSKEDSMITDRMLKAGELIGIQLVDHIIVGGSNENYFSFREKGLMEFEHFRAKTDYRDIEFPEYKVAEVSDEPMQTAPVRRRRGR